MGPIFGKQLVRTKLHVDWHATELPKVPNHSDQWAKYLITALSGQSTYSQRSAKYLLTALSG